MHRAIWPLLFALLPGCTVLNGQPDIAPAVWLFTANLQPNRAYLPPACPAGDTPAALAPFTNPYPGHPAPEANRIRLCADAIKQLIDLRWAAYIDGVQTADSTGNTAADSAKLALTGAATAAAGPAIPVLTGLATFIAGAQIAVDQDVLYRRTLALIVLQMEKDRAVWNSTILRQLDADAYANIYEAANDLFQYARAGSWTNALTAMQADSGAQTPTSERLLHATEEARAARP